MVDEYILSWLHISDIHFGHGFASDKWDQKLVLNKLLEDVANAKTRQIPKPDFIFVTGDIANTGHEYDEATEWLIQLANSIALDENHIFVIPGNHDIQRNVAGYDRNLQRLLHNLRSGEEKIDDTFAHDEDKFLLTQRLSNYLSFARSFAPFRYIHNHDDLFWHYRITHKSNLMISLLGLNTALLAEDQYDKGKLQLGLKQLEGFLLADKSAMNELKVVLSHHPFDWLSDYETASRWVRNNAHIHLYGHIHGTEFESLRAGSGSEYIKIISGATHSHSDEPVSHGYNIAALVHNQKDSEYGVRVWPRLWVDPAKEFRVDVNNVPDGLHYAQHNLKVSFNSGSLSADTSSDESPIPVIIKVASFGSTRLWSNCDSPPITPSWVGRHAELELLSDPSIKVLAITGIGGQGKSALAARYIEHNVNTEQFWDWRDCREQGDTLQTHLIRIIERISKGRIACSAFIDEGIVAVIEFFFEILDDKKGFFVFDNIDHYIDVSANKPVEGIKLLIDNALRKRHNSQFIFTCRPTVAYDNHPAFVQISLFGLSEPETLELFKLSGVDVKKGNTQQGIVEAQNLTQGHPLWLNLIAKQVAKNQRNLDDILTDMRQGKDLDLPSVMLNAIWKTLNDKQRKILRYMAEAVRPETEERLEEYICNELNWNQFSKALRVLKALNLIVIKTAPNTKKTLELHPLIRSFIRTEFPIKEREKFINKIASFFDLLISKMRGSIDKGASFSILEHWIFRAELALNANNYKIALNILNEVKNALRATGHPEEFVRVANLLFKELLFADAILNEYAHFDDVFSSFIDVLSHLGQYERADTFLRRYEDAIEGKSARYVNLCNLRCYMYWCKGAYEPAVEWGNRGVELKKKANIDTRFECEHNLALAQRDSGDIASALIFFLKGHALEEVLDREKVDEDRGGHFYGNIGRCLWFQDNIDGALICYQKAIDLLEKDDHEPNIIVNRGWGNFWIGEALEKKEDFHAAYCFYKKAFNLWKSIFPIKAATANSKIITIAKDNPDFNNINDYQLEAVCSRWSCK
ncbi:MAG: metallophosphoesterase [Nitrospirae bacterium]|nr:metallophosphoesterase [Nitrospirota bacterium]